MPISHHFEPSVWVDSFSCRAIIPTVRSEYWITTAAAEIQIRHSDGRCNLPKKYITAAIGGTSQVETLIARSVLSRDSSVWSFKGWTFYGVYPN